MTSRLSRHRVFSRWLVLAGFFIAASPLWAQTDIGSSTQNLGANVTITTAGTLGTVNVLTLGAPNKDFTLKGGYNNACVIGNYYNVNDICYLQVNFAPTRVGPRLGAVSLTDNTGKVVMGTTFVSGNSGRGPFVTFPASAAITTLGIGFGSPYGVAVDGSGNVFVADYSKNVVKEIVAVNGVVSAGSTVITVGSGFRNPQSVAVDGSGNVFVADYGNNAVKEIVAVNGVVSAGSTVKTVGSGFSTPNGVAVDWSDNVFVADTGHNLVKEIVAVNGVVNAGSTVNTVGSGFTFPNAVAVDGSGNVFVADEFNNAVKEIVAVNGVVSSGSTVNTVGSGFSYPTGVAVDGSGNVFVADSGNSAVKEIVAVNGVVSAGSTVNTLGSGFNSPVRVAVDEAGHVFVGDNGNNTVKELDLTALPSLAFATTVNGATSSDSPRSFSLQNAGNVNLTFSAMATGTANFQPNGAGSCNSGTVLAPSAVCTVAASFTPHAAGALTDSLTLTNNSLNAAGTTQAIALSGTGTPASQTITFPVLAVPGTGSYSLSATASSGLTVAYTVVSGPATVSGSTLTITAGGTVVVSANQSGNANYTAAPTVTNTIQVPLVTNVGTSSSSVSVAVTVTTAGTLGTINVLTQGAANKDYKFAAGGSCATGTAYSANATCTVFYTFTPSRPGQRIGAVSLTNSAGTGVMGIAFLTNTGTGPLTTFPINNVISTLGSGFKAPGGAAVDGNGNVFVADTGNNAIKEILAVNGVVSSSSTVLALGTQYPFSTPSGVAVDGSGNIYIANSAQNQILKISAVNGVPTATVTSLNTTGSEFSYPTGVAVDGSGNVFVADYSDGVVKELVAVNGIVNTASPVNTVGSGFVRPNAVAVDGLGNVFVTDLYNNTVSEIVAVNGVVNAASTVNTVGSGFKVPLGVAVDGSGNLFVSDYSDSTIKEVVALNGMVSTSSTVLTVASGFGTAPGLAVDGRGHLFIADSTNNVARQIDLTAAPSQAFATTQAGFTSTDSPRSVIVQNAGNTSLNFTSLATATAHFPLSGTETCSTASALGQNATCTVAANFTPQTGGTFTDALTMTDNSLNATGAKQTVALSGTATLGTKTISFRGFATPLYQNSMQTLSASASNGDPVTFAVTSGSATLSGTTITFTQLGNIQVTASSGATATYAAATPVSIIGNVYAAQTISFTQPATPAYKQSVATLLATGGGSGNPVTFSIVSGPATLSGTNNANILYTGNGTVVIAADQASNASFNAAPQVTRSVTVVLQSIFVVNGGGTVASFYESLGTQSGATAGGGIGAAVDGSGNFWSITAGGNGLSKFTDTGSLAATYAGSGTVAATALAIDGLGFIYVTNGAGTINALTNAGASVYSTPIGAAYAISGPTAVAVDSAGSLWIASPGNNTAVEMIGVAAPVVAPAVKAVIGANPGTRP